MSKTMSDTSHTSLKPRSSRLASDGSLFPGRSSPPANPRSEIGEVKLTDENRSPHYVENVGPSPEYHDIAGPGSLGGWSATMGPNTQRLAIPNLWDLGTNLCLHDVVKE